MTFQPARRPDITLPVYRVEEQRERFEEISAEFADDDAAASDAVLDLLTNDAIAERRLQDATFWQRVKFRSRMLRAMRAGAKRVA